MEHNDELALLAEYEGWRATETLAGRDGDLDAFRDHLEAKRARAQLREAINTLDKAEGAIEHDDLGAVVVLARSARAQLQQIIEQGDTE